MRSRSRPDVQPAPDPTPAAAGSGNRQLDVLQRANVRSLARVAEFREAYAAGDATFRDFSQLKHAHPYVGLVPCVAAGYDFVMFHANDDVVAWQYLWLGPDSYEADIVRIWAGWARISRLIYDIGAYTGLMAVVAAKANPQAVIHLFEPVDRTVERAKMNVVANSVRPQVTLHNKAASDADGHADINLYRDEDFLGTGNSLYDKSLEIIGVRRIDTVVVDTWLPDLAPDLIKIDVEGHELSTLRGLERSIAAGRPRMIVEVWEHTRDEVLDLLASWHYVVEPLEPSLVRVMNYTCVPAEKA